MNEDYLQPDFYRFNQDSLELVKWIASRNSGVQTIADLGAGCGIIGIELARLLRPRELQLVELQSEFHPYLSNNVAKFLPQETKWKILISSYGKWKPTEKFDLIAANPPYYLPGKGEPSHSAQRQICRSFGHENWEELIQAIASNLQDNGKGYLVVKERSEILDAAEKAISNHQLNSYLQKFNDVVLIELKQIG